MTVAPDSPEADSPVGQNFANASGLAVLTRMGGKQTLLSPKSSGVAIKHQADTHNRSPSPRPPTLHHPGAAAALKGQGWRGSQNFPA